MGTYMGTHLHLKQTKKREKSLIQKHILGPDSTCTDTEMAKTEHAEQDDVHSICMETGKERAFS